MLAQRAIDAMKHTVRRIRYWAFELTHNRRWVESQYHRPVIFVEARIASFSSVYLSEREMTICPGALGVEDPGVNLRRPATT